MELSSKMLKVVCREHSGDYILRITRSQLSRGFPLCGICKKRMVLDGPSVSVDFRNSRSPLIAGTGSGTRKTIGKHASIAKIDMPESAPQHDRIDEYDTGAR